MASGAFLSDSSGDQDYRACTYRLADEKLLLQPAEVAVVGPVVGGGGILVASGHWMWPKEEAKGRTPRSHRMRWKERQRGENRQAARGLRRGIRLGMDRAEGLREIFLSSPLESFRLQLPFPKHKLLPLLFYNKGWISGGSGFGTGLTGQTFLGDKLCKERFLAAQQRD